MRTSVLPLACLFVAACSDNGANETANVDTNFTAPPFDIDVTTKTKGETAAERKARLRKKAKTDPEGADAEAIQSMSRNEVIATAINTAGYLCARVTSAYPVGGNINVECIEYRNGSGRVRYMVDPNAGTVEPR
jgi:hypothetical protein